MADDRDGQIVTFYSYKGGTGRTMALANVAWILAANGRKVLAVDWDLEQPGLHMFFRPFLDEQRVHDAGGVYRLIMGFASESARRTRESGRADEDGSWHEQFVRLETDTVPVAWDFGDGSLDLLPAGEVDHAYASPASSVDWNGFVEHLDGSVFFEALRQSMKRSYDVVLIDSRSGRSDLGDICTVLFPDTLVDCFTMSDQSIDGAAAAASRIVERYTRPVRILPVPMRVDPIERGRLDIGRATIQAAFKRFVPGPRARDAERYWRAVEVPYVPYYAYEEILAVFAEQADSPNTVLGSFERLTSEITRGAIVRLPPMCEEVRVRHLQQFLRRHSHHADVYLSYVPEDRPWADWLRSLLRDAGLQVAEPEDADVTIGPRRNAGLNVRYSTRVVAVLSRSYLKSPEVDVVQAEIKTRDPLGAHGLIVPVFVGGASVANPFPPRTSVDLEHLEETAARQTVLRALGVDLAALSGLEADDHSRPRYPGADPAGVERSRPEPDVHRARRDP